MTGGKFGPTKLKKIEFIFYYSFIVLVNLSTLNSNIICLFNLIKFPKDKPLMLIC